MLVWMPGAFTHVCHKEVVVVLIVDAALDQRWRAAYVWSPDLGGPGLTVRLFRKHFYLEKAPASFVVYVTADSRYRFWANGHPVGRGPLKGTLDHYHYETYDLAAYLRSGENVLAVEVRWFGDDAPASEVHARKPGLLVQGPEAAGIDTPAGWRVLADRSVTPDKTPYIANADKFLNHWECVDAAVAPGAWWTLDYDDAGWDNGVNAGVADFPGTWGEAHPLRRLRPRDLPALIEMPRRFQGVVRHTGQVVAEQNPAGGLDLRWSLPPGEGGELVLDAGHLTTGYPVFTFDGDAEREVRITYGECALQLDDKGGYRAPVKAVRDDFTFGDVHGYRDTVRLPGDSLDRHPYVYEPFHWRTFWYVRLEVSPGPGAFALSDVYYRFTTYPQTMEADFHAAIPDSDRMWEVSWRTLQLCAHETYEDCPYYEQLNYVADSRLQARCSLVLAGETRLPRHTIRIYRDSVRSDGLIHSRVPSVIPQVKPYFALIWILMVHDYWRWTGDRAFVRTTLNVVDSILWFFREHLKDDGFVGRLPFWHMVDKVPSWPQGTPPAVRDGASTYMTGLYAHALDRAIRLHNEAGEPADAQRWQSLVARVRDAIQTLVWSDVEGLFLEGPGREDDPLSQHSQVMAILAGATTPAQAERILTRLTTDASLIGMTFTQSFYLARALEHTGGYAAFASHLLQPWREALAKHLTTWPEYPDPTRSDCHAWSSWIAADFITGILGIQPHTPGFETVRIAPQVGVCNQAHGAAPTPHGPVTVRWRRDMVAGAVQLTATVPDGLPAVVHLPGREPVSFPDGGEIAYSCDL